jgi:hypothetical protein
MVGGHTRNIGKTSVVEAIIREMPELNWTAVKVTQFGHGVCSIDGEPCECQTAEHEFSITTERERNSGTDTARFLAAGARRSLWVRVRQGELFKAVPAIRKELQHDGHVIIESNSLRRFITPDVFLQVVQPSNSDLKTSSQTLFDLADGYLLVTDEAGVTDDAQLATAPDEERCVPNRTAGVILSASQLVRHLPVGPSPAAALLAHEVVRNKPCFPVSSRLGFISDEVLSFVRSILARVAA